MNGNTNVLKSTVKWGGERARSSTWLFYYRVAFNFGEEVGNHPNTLLALADGRFMRIATKYPYSKLKKKEEPAF